MPTDDLEAATPGELFNVLRDLDRGVKGLRGDVQDEVAARTRSLRWVVAVGGLVVALALVGAAVTWAQAGRLQREVDIREADRIAAAVVDCEKGNETRKAVEDRFQSFIDVLGGLAAPATTEEAQAQKALIDKLRSDFAASQPPALGATDCSAQELADPAAGG